MIYYKLTRLCLASEVTIVSECQCAELFCFFFLCYTKIVHPASDNEGTEQTLCTELAVATFNIVQVATKRSAAAVNRPTNM